MLDFDDAGETTVYQSLPMWVSSQQRVFKFRTELHRENEQRQVSTYLDRWRERMLKLSCYFPLSRTPECFSFLAMVWKHPPSSVERTCIAGSGGPSLYFFRDRRCTDCQGNRVVCEGEIMRENIFPDMGIQVIFASNQRIYRAE